VTTPDLLPRQLADLVAQDPPMRLALTDVRASGRAVRRRQRAQALVAAAVVAVGTAGVAVAQHGLDRDAPVAPGSGRAASRLPSELLAAFGDDLSKAGPEQAAEIADGKITEAEYVTSFNRYRDCLRRGGFELREVRREQGKVEFGLPAEAVDSGVDRPCYDREFYFVDVLWQVPLSR
jgi:hypothetical protein